MAQALAQHPALVKAGQQFDLVTSDGTATAATVPLLLSGWMPPKATLIWRSNNDTVVEASQRLGDTGSASLKELIADAVAEGGGGGGGSSAAKRMRLA